MNESVELISLSELIEQVKADLLTQVATRGARNPLFFVDAVELTAQVVARREKGEGGQAGLSLSVLGFKADAGIDTKTTVGSQLTQSVTIKLSPLLGKADYLQGLTGDETAALRHTLKQGGVRGQDDGTGEIA
jgi:hypothetical protein